MRTTLSSKAPACKACTGILALVACVFSFLDFVLAFFFYDYQNNAMTFHLPSYQTLICGVLLLAACVLLAWGIFAARKTQKSSPLAPIAAWGMALHLLMHLVFSHEGMDSLSIVIFVLVCGVLVTAGMLAVNKLHSAVMAIVVLAVGVGFVVYRTVDSWAVLQSLLQNERYFYFVGNLTQLIAYLGFFAALGLSELRNAAAE